MLNAINYEILIVRLLLLIICVHILSLRKNGAFMEKITVEIVYRYLTVSGGDKTVYLRMKNVSTEKEEEQLMEIQELAKEHAENSMGLDLDVNGRVSDSGQTVYVMDIVSPFDEKEEGSQSARELLEFFCERA